MVSFYNPRSCFSFCWTILRIVNRLEHQLTLLGQHFPRKCDTDLEGGTEANMMEYYNKPLIDLTLIEASIPLLEFQSALIEAQDCQLLEYKQANSTMNSTVERMTSELE